MNDSFKGFAELTLLAEIVSAISESEKLEGLNRLILAKCMEHFEVEIGSIHLVTTDRAIAPNHPASLITAESLMANQGTAPAHIVRGIAGWVARNGTPLLSNDLRSDHRFRFTGDELGALRSAIAVPLSTGGRLSGVLSVFSRGERPFGSEDLVLLGVIAAQAAQVIRAVQSAIEEEKTQSELRAASAIQQSLLPASSPHSPFLDVHGVSIPARYVGGDYYDWIERPGGGLGCIVADVCGKGLPAALLMAQLQGLFKPLAESRNSPSLVMTSLNEHLRRTLQSDVFITAWFGVLQPESDQLAFANAAHPPPILLRANAELRELDDSELFLHALNNRPFTLYQVPFEPGDVLIVYSDGVTDALDVNDTPWQTEGLHNALRTANLKSAKSIVDHLVDRLHEHTGSREQYDDITLAVIRRYS